MRVMGIDPGSQFMGLACVEARGSQLICVGHAVIRISPADWSLRLKEIFEAVAQKIEEWQPQQLAVEEVFFAKNPQSALKLGQARGAALVAGGLAALPLFEYPATKVKQSIAASGRADKTQILRMIEILLGESLKKHPPLARHDASDALALAICHLQHLSYSERMRAKNKSLGAGI